MSGEGDTPYVFFSNLRQSFGDQDAWRPPPDLDEFFTQVYEYYRGKGLRCSILSQIFNLL
jgi:hypothetical protein